MEDFFKQFKGNLEHRPEPAFEEQDWQALQKRLDQTGKKRPAAGFAWWWLALPAVLMLLASNTVLFMKWKKMEQKVAALDIRRDTVFHTQVIHITDTIYRTRVVRERVVEYQTADYAASGAGATQGRPGTPRALLQPNLLFSGNHLAYPAGFFPSGHSTGAGQSRSGTAGALFQPRSLLFSGNQSPYPVGFFPPGLGSDLSSAENSRAAVELAHLKPRTWHSPWPLPPVISAEPPIIKRKKSLRHLLYPLRPKEFEVGVAGGWAHPFSQGLDKQTGCSAGLRAAVGFSPRLRLWADATYLKVRFETDRMDPAIGVPPVQPPSDDFKFQKAEVPQPSLQYSAGLQYLFRAHRPLKPYIGLGYGAVMLLPYEVTYVFENKQLGIEWNLDTEIDRRELATNFLLLRGGFEYPLAQRWTTRLEANYRTNWRKTGFHAPQMLGIQAGLSHHF